MRKQIKIIIPGVPKPLPRARSYKKKNMKFIKHYLPKEAKVYRKIIQDTAQELMNSNNYDLWEEPVTLKITFMFPRPKNKIWKTKTMPMEAKTTRPDLTNLEKAIEDALNKVVLLDDSQIVHKETWKIIAPGLERPKTYIIVEEFDIWAHTPMKW